MDAHVAIAPTLPGQADLAGEPRVRHPRRCRSHRRPTLFTLAPTLSVLSPGWAAEPCPDQAGKPLNQKRGSSLLRRRKRAHLSIAAVAACAALDAISFGESAVADEGT